MSGCNNCHDALATTFHTPDRGGNVVVCRLCHITKAAGSHLELQSRSIDSYTHAIHRFQDFDTGTIDFTDPVEAMEYNTMSSPISPRSESRTAGRATMQASSMCRIRACRCLACFRIRISAPSETSLQ